MPLFCKQVGANMVSFEENAPQKLIIEACDMEAVAVLIFQAIHTSLTIIPALGY